MIYTRLIAFAILGLGLSAYADGQDPFAPENERRPDEKSPAAAKSPNGPEKKTRKTTQDFLVDMLQFDIKVTPPKARPGAVVRVELMGKLKDAYTYPITMRHPKQAERALTKLSYKLPADISPLYPINESGTDVDEEFGILKHVKDFTWSQDFYIDPKAKPGTQRIGLSLFLQVCSKKTRSCYGPADYPDLAADLEITGDPPAAAPGDLESRLKPMPVEVALILDNASATKNKKDPTVAAKGGTAGGGSVDRSDLTGLLSAAFFGAFLMLLTPCVFPMIPITVNFFIKQSEKEHHRPLFMASVYSGTIIFMLTLVMLVLGNVVVWLANDPWFNLILGGVLVFFALSLFGMYEIELPSFLARFTSAREGQGGLIGTVFMAMTFTITSFTCTGPFLGIMLAPVAGIKPPLVNLVLAAVVYSATFAAPFFVLALFPTVLKKLPKSGGWMNVIKVTMGFLELGAALKFLANTDYTWYPGNPRLFNFDTVLCAWIALSLATGLYLFGIYRLPHDDPPEHIGVVRMLFASAFIGLAVYMTPVLFGIKPKGLVMDSIIAFLPPKLDDGQAVGLGGGLRGGERLEWQRDYEVAWKEAIRDNKLVFIDFTGVYCTNCRDNEVNVFPKPEVIAELKKYVRVQLYCSPTVPDPKLSAQESRQLALRHDNWRDILSDPTLPTYLVFEPARDQAFDDGVPKGRVVDRRNGAIFDVADFVRFLSEPVKSPQTASR